MGTFLATLHKTLVPISLLLSVQFLPLSIHSPVFAVTAASPVEVLGLEPWKCRVGWGLALPSQDSALAGGEGRLAGAW